MKHSDVEPDDFTFVSILKVCTGKTYLDEGKLIHMDVVKAGYEANLFVGNTLMYMYAKCGSMEGMQQVFDNLPKRDLISWNVIIAGYSQQNLGLHALQLFMQMQHEGISPDTFTFVSILKACSTNPSLHQGKLIHTHLTLHGLESNTFIRNTLVDMYAKVGDLDAAQRVFDQISMKDVVVWNTMIRAYAQLGLASDALRLFDSMQKVGTVPNRITFGSILKACYENSFIDQGRRIHAQIVKCGLESDRFAGSALVDMYVKCGCLEEACQVFHKLLEKDVVSWNIMIAGYAQKGQGVRALELFKQMQEECLKPNLVTFLSVLKACASTQSINIGRSIHKQILESEVASNTSLGNAIVDMYAKCGYLDEACTVFSGLKEKDTVSWNTMINAFTIHDHPRKALELFRVMQEEDFNPNSVTIVSVLKACSGLNAISEGRLIHEHVKRKGHLLDLSVGSALVDMYCKCSSFEEARQLFDSLPEKSLVTWNTMITGYCQHGDFQKARQLFKDLQLVGIVPDGITYANILKACGRMNAIDQIRLIHEELCDNTARMDSSVSSALIDSYAKCGNLAEALSIFTSLARPGVESWNAMIGAYVKHGLSHKAIKLYADMLEESMKPDVVTFVTVLKACSSIGAIEHGKVLHDMVRREGLDKNTFVGNALIDMYTKCGSLDLAHGVFGNLIDKDVVSWNSMISGYAHYGLGQQAIALFKAMHGHGLRADHATFVSVLSACSHTSLLEEGFQVLESMAQDFGIAPTLQHCSCIVDLLSRAGNLTDAEGFIRKVAAQ